MATALAARFPRLAQLPRVAAVVEATPLERASRLSRFSGADVWVKRDDRTNPLYGGNKIRKLAYLLGDARAKGADTLITAGALGSHHALATALHGKEHGFHVHAVLSPQPWTDHVEENLRAHVALGTTLHGVRSLALAQPTMMLEALKLRRAGHHPYLIPFGGSNVIGTFGYVEAGLELALQLEAGGLGEPDAVYCALGSGATAVGLAIGLAAAGMLVPVRAVLVTSKLVGNRYLLSRLAHATVRALRAVDPRFPDVAALAMEQLVVEEAWLGVGYGVVNEEVERVTDLAEQDGLVLDPSYTAPTVATMLEAVASGDVRRPLYVHSLSSADLGPLLRRAPVAPAFARALAGAAR